MLVAKYANCGMGAYLCRRRRAHIGPCQLIKVYMYTYTCVCTRVLYTHVRTYYVRARPARGRALILYYTLRVRAPLCSSGGARAKAQINIFLILLLYCCRILNHDIEEGEDCSNGSVSKQDSVVHFWL